MVINNNLRSPYLIPILPPIRPIRPVDLSVSIHIITGIMMRSVSRDQNLHIDPIVKNTALVARQDNLDQYSTILTGVSTKQPEVTGTRDTFAFHLTRESTGSGVQSPHKAQLEKERKKENSIGMRQPRCS